MNKKLMDSMGIEWPRKLLFLGSGLTETPDEWLATPSIRTNARTLGRFPTNDIFGIMTWPTPKYEGLGGVFGTELYRRANPKPYLFIFDLHFPQERLQFHPTGTKMFFFGTRDRFESSAFQRYVHHSKTYGYQPRNSTGLYIVLWLLYADVDEIYISGYDGWMALSGTEPGKWDIAQPHYAIDGVEWCADGNEAIQQNRPGKFFMHNLWTEWLAIEDAIKVAEERGVKVFVSYRNKETDE